MSVPSTPQREIILIRQMLSALRKQLRAIEDISGDDPTRAATLEALQDFGSVIVDGMDHALKYATPIREMVAQLSSSDGISRLVKGAFDELFRFATGKVMEQVNSLRDRARVEVTRLATEVAEPVIGAVSRLKAKAQDLISTVWDPLTPNELIADIESLVHMLTGDSGQADGTGAGFAALLDMAAELAGSPDGLAHLLNVPSSLRGVCDIYDADAPTPSEHRLWRLSSFELITSPTLPALANQLRDDVGSCLDSSACQAVLGTLLSNSLEAMELVSADLLGIGEATALLGTRILAASRVAAQVKELVPAFEEADEWAAALSLSSTSVKAIFQRGWCGAQRKGVTASDAAAPAWLRFEAGEDCSIVWSSYGRRLQVNVGGGFLEGLLPALSIAEKVAGQVRELITYVKQEGEALFDDKVKPAALHILREYVVPFRSAVQKVSRFVHDMLDRFTYFRDRVLDPVQLARRLTSMVVDSYFSLEEQLPVRPSKLYNIFTNLEIAGDCTALEDAQAVGTRLAGASSIQQVLDIFPPFIASFVDDANAVYAVVRGVTGGLIFSDIYSVPSGLLAGFSRVICMVQRVVHTLRVIIGYAREKLDFLSAQLSLGTWVTPSAPDCALDSSGYCLVTQERSSLRYRAFLFPVKHLMLWDLASPPLANPCRGRMSQKWTIPGLMSQYSLQAATFLRIGSDNIKSDYGEVVCSVPTYVLTFYAAVRSSRPGNTRATLLVVTDAHGTVLSVQQTTQILGEGDGVLSAVSASQSSGPALSPTQELALAIAQATAGDAPTDPPVADPLRRKYTGTFTGLAVSWETYGLYACGQERDEEGQPSGKWYIHTFMVYDLAFNGRGPVPPLNTPKSTMDSMHRTRVAPERNPYTHCSLAWEPTNRFLWVAFTAARPEDGTAMAYVVEGADGRLRPLKSSVTTSIRVGPDVTGLAFFPNAFGDRHLAISRCQFGSAKVSSSKQCVIEFHNYNITTSSQSGYLLSAPNDGSRQSKKGDATLKLTVPVPRGIAGLTYDASAGADGQYFVAPCRPALCICARALGRVYHTLACHVNDAPALDTVVCAAPPRPQLLV